MPVLSNILEIIINKHLYKYLSDRNIFFSSQVGFRKNHSTINAVTQFATEALTSLDKKEYLVVIFLDLSKAFDTIDHNLLLRKLEKYSIHGHSLSWIESYPSGRKQFVNYNGTKSSLHDVLCGIPQGYILGPLLFLIYIVVFRSLLYNRKKEPATR